MHANGIRIRILIALLSVMAVIVVIPTVVFAEQYQQSTEIADTEFRIPNNDTGATSDESLRLPFSLGTISPMGAAMLGAIVAAGLALLVMGYYNKRAIRENSQV